MCLLFLKSFRGSRSEFDFCKGWRRQDAAPKDWIGLLCPNSPKVVENAVRLYMK